jgi:hypothetical protein
MGFPIPPGPPVLLVALLPLRQDSWASLIGPVAVGASFWAYFRDAPSLVAASQARPWVPGDPPAPPAEPPKTVHGSAGFAAGASNASPKS